MQQILGITTINELRRNQTVQNKDIGMSLVEILYWQNMKLGKYKKLLTPLLILAYQFTSLNFIIYVYIYIFKFYLLYLNNSMISVTLNVESLIWKIEHTVIVS